MVGEVEVVRFDRGINYSLGALLESRLKLLRSKYYPNYVASDITHKWYDVRRFTCKFVS